jgi:two-component system, chemotaxis family, chemotaxis protein CheY
MLNNKIRIMIVDDSEFMRTIIFNALKENGYSNIIFSKNSTEAINNVKAFLIDIIFMDINMPGKDGIATLKEIKKINPTIKCIIVSSIVQKETINKAMEIGALDYITKPFKPERLIEVLNNALRIGV